MKKLTKKKMFQIMDKHKAQSDDYEFVQNNTIEYVLENMSTDLMVFFIKYAPEFSEYCYEWQYFETYHWVELLLYQPQFANRCDKWHEFGENDLEKILTKHPLLAMHIR